MNNQEFEKHLDILEQLVENSPSFMGKRMVNEELFFVEIMKIRHKLHSDGPPQKFDNPSDKNSP